MPLWSDSGGEMVTRTQIGASFFFRLVCIRQHYNTIVWCSSLVSMWHTHMIFMVSYFVGSSVEVVLVLWSTCDREGVWDVWNLNSCIIYSYYVDTGIWTFPPRWFLAVLDVPPLWTETFPPWINIYFLTHNIGLDNIIGSFVFIIWIRSSYFGKV